MVPLAAASASTGLIIAGYFVSPPGGTILETAAYNRLMGTVVLWILTAVLLKSKKNPTDKPIAQNPGMVAKPKIMLTCAPGQGKDVSTPLYVKNPTATDIASGKVIYWSATQKGTATGKETTTAVLKKRERDFPSLE